MRETLQIYQINDQDKMQTLAFLIINSKNPLVKSNLGKFDSLQNLENQEYQRRQSLHSLNLPNQSPQLKQYYKRSKSQQNSPNQSFLYNQSIYSHQPRQRTRNQVVFQQPTYYSYQPPRQAQLKRSISQVRLQPLQKPGQYPYLPIHQSQTERTRSQMDYQSSQKQNIISYIRQKQEYDKRKLQLLESIQQSNQALQGIGFSIPNTNYNEQRLINELHKLHSLRDQNQREINHFNEMILKGVINSVTLPPPPTPPPQKPQQQAQGGIVRLPDGTLKIVQQQGNYLETASNYQTPQKSPDYYQNPSSQPKRYKSNNISPYNSNNASRRNSHAQLKRTIVNQSLTKRRSSSKPNKLKKVVFTIQKKLREQNKKAKLQQLKSIQRQYTLARELEKLKEEKNKRIEELIQVKRKQKTEIKLQRRNSIKRIKSRMKLTSLFKL